MKPGVCACQERWFDEQATFLAHAMKRSASGVRVRSQKVTLTISN